jgi:hypothetical protein
MTTRRPVSTTRKTNGTTTAKSAPEAALSTPGATKLKPTKASDDALTAKHQQAAEMVRDLRSRAEALSASADRLLERLA